MAPMSPVPPDRSAELARPGSSAVGLGAGYPVTDEPDSSARSEYDSPRVRTQVRLARVQRRAAQRARWWFPFVVAGCALAGLWGLLKTDQYLADRLFWPNSGARFVEVGPIPADPDSTGGTIVVVAGGLNRRSGTGPALALMPALSADGARVFSLVYGSGISDRDIEDKFDALLDRYRPDRVDFFGSSMGGDVVLGLAGHLQRVRADNPLTQDAAVDARPIPAQVRGGGSMESATRSRFVIRVTAPVAPPVDPTAPPLPPRLGVIYLDCTPLGAAEVRDAGRTKADALTAVSEALHTDGGVGLRLTAEVLAQQPQWSTGRFPFVDVRWDDLAFKVRQVWTEKIDGPGVSTQLIKDQYGVIRRTDIAAIAEDLGAGTRVVYFRPEVSSDDRVVRVGAAEQTLRRLAVTDGLEVAIARIPDGHHASAESNPHEYLAVLNSMRTARGS
jgi:pimeloyl-ACP methyl ester carboxylesterase